MFGQELDNYWKTVVNTISDGIMIVNTHGAIVSVNRAFESITGYNRAEVIGKPCTILDCDICQKALNSNGGPIGVFCLKPDTSDSQNASSRAGMGPFCMR